MNREGTGAFGPQGPAAETIADLWWLMLALGGAAFVLFAVVLAVALFRRRAGDPTAGAGPRDGPDARPGGAEPEGSLERRLIVGGGVVLPVVVLAVVLGATIAAMRAVSDTVPAGALEVEVVGHQWWYEVRYPAEGVVTANELHLPVGRPVAVRLTSADVIHSFWVPALAGKVDMLPDGTNTLVLRADRAGEHFSRCAEFCGLQHTRMALTVVAEPPDAFAAWVASRQGAAAEPADGAARRGREVFASAGCGSCHTVRGTAAAGRDGPDLTHVAGRPTLAAGTLTNTRAHMAEWLSDPQRVKEGVNMQAAGLPPGELDALVAYLEGLR